MWVGDGEEKMEQERERIIDGALEGVKVIIQSSSHWGKRQD